MTQQQPGAAGASVADVDIAALVAGVQHEAFRLELLSAYDVPEEAEQLSRFLAGDPIRPDEVPGLVTYFGLVGAVVRRGARVRRVRILDEPLTDYQRWLYWSAPWNMAAGEEVRHLSRSVAAEVGLLEAAGDRQDWWLFDSATLVLLSFDEQGRLIGAEVSTDPERTAQACAWRDLAVHHSVPDQRDAPELKGPRATASGVAEPSQGAVEPPA